MKNKTIVSSVIAASLLNPFSAAAWTKDNHVIKAQGYELPVTCSRDFNQNGRPTLPFLQRLDRFIHDVQGISYNKRGSFSAAAVESEIKGHGGGAMLSTITNKCAPS